MPEEIDLLISNAGQLVTCAAGDKPRRGLAMRDVGLIPHGSVAIHQGRILAVGAAAELNASYRSSNTLDASSKVVCPGFVDPHTHVVYAGERLDEFEMRIQGASYMEIMRAGGGIVSTMKATREAALDELIRQSRHRLDAMLTLGTTTVEVKSGYGLNSASELKMLQAIEALDREHPVDLVPTFLGAHAVPQEYQDHTDEYVSLVIDEMLPAAAEWYRSSSFAQTQVPLFCDVFCEAGVFDREQAERILVFGLGLGLLPKLHADEFQSLGGVDLAVQLGAISVDHLDVTPPQEIERLSNSNTCGVVLPAVNFNLGSRDFADARAMIDAGVALALATDINPGSAPCPSMPTVMAIACRYQKLLPAEAFNAATINAAFALGLGDRLGSLEPGKQADLLIVDAHDYRQLAYEFGANQVEQVIKKGRLMNL
jgi:imidazolonepropionase